MLSHFVTFLSVVDEIYGGGKYFAERFETNNKLKYALRYTLLKVKNHPFTTFSPQDHVMHVGHFFIFPSIIIIIIIVQFVLDFVQNGFGMIYRYRCYI